MSTNQKTIETMFSAGAHFGLGRSRRHPTVSPFIFGTKNSTDILDLEKTEVMLEKAGPSSPSSPLKAKSSSSSEARRRLPRL